MNDDQGVSTSSLAASPSTVAIGGVAAISRFSTDIHLMHRFIDNDLARSVCLHAVPVRVGGGWILCFCALLVASLGNSSSGHAATLVVQAGGDLQAAIDAAQPGDTILLQPGAAYTGGFRLPWKAGDTYITIRTDTTVVGEGTRVTPADAGRMAKVVSPGLGMPAISTEPGAHHYRLVGLEIMPVSASAVVYELVALGTAGPEQNTLASVPHHIVIDRCFIHGWPDANFKRGIGLNSAHTEILNSHISDFHSDFQDSQALAGSNGPGPFRIINNRVEGAAENIAFGGATPGVVDLVPSDIEIRRNHLYKPMSWKPGEQGSTDYRPWIKNLLQLKNAQDVVVDGNIMENNWHQGDQHGTAIILSPRSEWGTTPWAVVQRVTFTNNVFINVGGGVGILNRDTGVPNLIETNSITFRNNLFVGIRNDYSIDGSRVIQVTGSSGIIFDHNTILHEGYPIRAYGAQTAGFVYTNNITHYGGVYGGVLTDCGMNQAALNCLFPGATFVNNAFIGGPPGAFSAFNFYPPSESAIGFEDPAAGNYRLAATSPYKNAGSDGKDLGADIDAIEAAYQNKIQRPDANGGGGLLQLYPLNVATGSTTMITQTLEIPQATAWVGFFPPGACIGSSCPAGGTGTYRDWYWVNGCRQGPIPTTAVSALTTCSDYSPTNRGLGAGTYDVRLFASAVLTDGYYTSVATATLSVGSVENAISLGSPTASTYGTTTLTHTLSAPEPTAWVGFYPAGACVSGSCPAQVYLDWYWVGTCMQGSVPAVAPPTSSTCGDYAPGSRNLAPGTYDVRLFANATLSGDYYMSVASAPLEISPSPYWITAAPTSLGTTGTTTITQALATWQPTAWVGFYPVGACTGSSCPVAGTGIYRDWYWVASCTRGATPTATAQPQVACAYDLASRGLAPGTYDVRLFTSNDTSAGTYTSVASTVLTVAAADLPFSGFVADKP